MDAAGAVSRIKDIATFEGAQFSSEMASCPGSGHGLRVTLLGGRPAGTDDAPWSNVLRPREAARFAAARAGLAGESARSLGVLHSEPRKGNYFNSLNNGPWWHDIR